MIRKCQARCIQRETLLIYIIGNDGFFLLFIRFKIGFCLCILCTCFYFCLSLLFCLSCICAHTVSYQRIPTSETIESTFSYGRLFDLSHVLYVCSVTWMNGCMSAFICYDYCFASLHFLYISLYNIVSP